MPEYIKILNQRIYGLEERKTALYDKTWHKRIATRSLLKNITNMEFDSGTGINIDCSDNDIASFICSFLSMDSDNRPLSRPLFFK